MAHCTNYKLGGTPKQLIRSKSDKGVSLNDSDGLGTTTG